jgi:probable addiction module antidote protein
MSQSLAPFDPSDYLDDDRLMALYLTEAATDADPGVFLAALGDVAKARGMAEVARKAGLGRESLYKALSTEAHPRHETISAVLKALGLKIVIAPAMEADA